jgi:hypothetical protein
MMMEIELEKAVNRNEMIAELHKRDCKVIFRKVDGSERTMICTLQESAIETGKAAQDVKSRNENVLAVWDVENKGWRSFRINSVISFS